ncbi:MAG: GTPase domain-containing protein [Candidatus Hodarchaeales archaeon]
MTLLAVKVFNHMNQEILSSFSISKNECDIEKAIPDIKSLLLSSNTNEKVQGWVCGEHCFAFSHFERKKLLLVAIASRNTPFVKLKRFLNLLEISLIDLLKTKHVNEIQEIFQEICNSVIISVDNSTKLNISLLGLSKSGKTTFIHQYITGQRLAGFNSYEPTPLLNIVSYENSSLHPQIDFFDLGMAFRQHWWKFSSESDGYIFFVDMADNRSIKRSISLFEEIRNFWDLPFVVAANKMDMCSIKNPRRYLSRKLLVPIRLIFEVETSTGSGFDKLLQGLIKNQIRAISERTPVISQHNSKNKSK